MRQAESINRLSRQEHRCRDYAAARGYVVEAVFHDDVSGGGDFIADTDVPSILGACEKRIRDLEERKIVLAERIANYVRALPDFDDALKTSLDFLRNPGNLWDSPRLEDKRAVLKLAFAGRLAYTRNEGFKTPDVSLPFKVLEGFRGGNALPD